MSPRAHTHHWPLSDLSCWYRPAATPIFKKQKKANATPTVNMGSMDKLQERAMRFQREHEIERQKQQGHYSSSEPYSALVNSPSSFNNGQTASSSWLSSSGPAHNVRRKFLKASANANDTQASLYDAVSTPYFHRFHR